MSNPDDLRRALVDAYEPYVRRRLAERGVPGDGLADALAEGRGWLDGALADLLGRPFAEQRRGPLELFQEAMRFPTAALAEAGVPAVPRDETAVQALPGDRYHLAPASSAEVDEETWRRHLAWGAAKARAMTAGGPGADPATER